MKTDEGSGLRQHEEVFERLAPYANGMTRFALTHQLRACYRRAMSELRVPLVLFLVGLASAGCKGDGGGTGELGDGGSTLGDGGMPYEPDVCAAWSGVFPDGAFRATPADRANLQSLLDTHNLLQLAPGNYRNGGPASITLKSNQAIISLGPVPFPDILVSAGTMHAHVRGVQQNVVSFEAGASTRYNCFALLKNMKVHVIGATVERNVFLSMSESAFNVDTSGGGNFSDNRIVKFNSHGQQMPIDLKGDAARMSGGNAFLLFDSQSTPGSVISVDGQRDVSFYGVNAEVFDSASATTTPSLMKVTNTGTLRGYHFIGVTKAGNTKYPGLDLDAENVILHDVHLSTDSPQLRLGSNVKNLFSWRNFWTGGDIDDRGGAGLRFFAEDSSDGNDVAVRLAGAEITAPPAMATNDALRTLLTAPGRMGGPWQVPQFGAIPDPTGATWNADRAGKGDDLATLQQMVNTQTIAQLEGKTYYVSGPIVLGNGQGLVGANNGKTAIVALTGGIDMVSIQFGDPTSCNATTGNFTLANITFQGGENGVRSNYAGVQVNQAVMSNVTFRDLSGSGVFIDGAYGWDNNFFDYLNFVDSGYGFRQEGGPKPSKSCYANAEWPTMSYVDKTVLYRSQFLRTTHALVMHPTRANNLDAVVESSFRGGDAAAIDLNSSSAGMVIASCEFIDNVGNPVVGGGLSVVNSTFVADRGGSMIGPGIECEGCTFARGSSTNAAIFGNVAGGDLRNVSLTSIANSVSKDMPIGAVATTVPVGGIYFNNALPATEPLDAFMSTVEYRTHGTPDSADDSRSVYTLLTGASSPGSQVLFGGSWLVP